MKQPNIVLIMADQMAAGMLPVYGHPIVKAPNLSRLAQQGVVFENAYCNNPICAASRFSMMSGQLATRIGAYDNAAEFPASIPTFAHYLRMLGYHTCLSGKMHFVGPDQLHGFEERVTTDIYPADFGWTPNWLEQPQLPPSGMSMRSVVEAGVCKRSMQLDYDEEVTHQAEQKIYDYARENRSSPFFLTVSLTHPHNPFTITREFWDLYDHDEIDMPRNPGVPFEQQDPFSQRYSHLIRMDEHRVTKDHVRNSRHAYYGMISYVDSLVGRLLKALEAMDLRKDTVVIFTVDHGEMMGERGLWYKFNPFEPSIRIPLIVSVPRGKSGIRTKRVVSLLDMLPTLIDLGSGGSPPDLVNPVDGHSLTGLLKGDDANWRDEVMVEFTAEGTIAPCLILRQDRYKYIHCGSDPAMLFDLESDPDELVNLANDPKHAATVKKMHAEVLRRWKPDELYDKIIESQQQRLFLQRAITTGVAPTWDWEPRKNAARQYVRSSGSPTAVKGLARFPFVPPTPPDFPRPARQVEPVKAEPLKKASTN